jgi:transcriptional regulator with XRE-family HTH domain
VALLAEKYRTKKRSDRIEMTDEARVLKILRSETKLSMKKVADLIGMSDSYIAHVETGRIDVPEGEKLNRLLKVYCTQRGTFRERVRTFAVQITPELELMEMVYRLRPHEMKTLVALAKSMVSTSCSNL